MDTCVIPLRHGGLSLVQTTDYIYPIVDDPYMMVSWLKLIVSYIADLNCASHLPSNGILTVSSRCAVLIV